jgi:hypothetical protein
MGENTKSRSYSKPHISNIRRHTRLINPELLQKTVCV